MFVYVVSVISKCGNSTASVSQDGYKTLDEAIEFIMSRSDNPCVYRNWIYEGEDNIYSINEINIKE